MATAYTSLLGLALPVTGELSGTWGATVNDEITALLDSAVAGTTSITADADITLSDTDGVANETRQAIILWSPATGTTTRNITAPARSKAYIVINASGGTQSIVLRGAGPTTGVTIVQGEKAVCAWNGSDFVKVANQNGIGNFTTVDTTNLEVTNLKALDGTAAGSIANSTGVVTLASSVLTTTDINGGTIDGTAIGGSTAAAGSFTTLSASSTLTVTGAGSIQGLTVGRGAGAVSTNTAVGASALAANTTGASNTSVGTQALASNTTAPYNTAIGYQAGYTNTEADRNTFLGGLAGYTFNSSGSTGNTLVGFGAGYFLTTGTANTFVGAWNPSTTLGAGQAITTGSKNTILGNFDGNSSGLDIRTASNYIVLSDGDGNPLVSTADNKTVALEGAVPNSGTGITFPATQSASSNANTLDDYEEGTWTPALTAGTGSITSFTATGVYTKIGKQVTATCSATLTDNGTGGLFIRIAGLPFVPSATTSVYGINDSVGTMLKGASTAASDIYLQTYNALYPGVTGDVILVTAIYFV